MRADQRDDLFRGWCLTLLEEFRKLQAKHPPLRSLRAPNLVVRGDLERTLGQWDEDSRAIALSERLLEHAGFNDVLAVFHHEVAHQIVSELYGIRDAVAHGEAFRRACRLLGIPAAARMEIREDRDESSARVMARIRKLLALGDSPNRHEAERALAKAHELALRHNIDTVREGVDRVYDLRIVTPVFKRVPSWIWSICGIVSDFYFTLYICRRQDDASGQRYQTIELYGTPDNLQMGEYVYYFLLHQGEAAWNAYRREKKRRTAEAGAPRTTAASSRREKISFLNGLYEGFRETLERQRSRLAESTALVWSGDPALEAFYRQRNPHVSTRSVSSALEESAHAAGQIEGRKLRLRPGLDSGGTQGATRLLEDRSS